ncbi:MAG: neutral/alkaline non-lysosomal ceramidase N-terminal domain-containing protein [Planctomycetes bacterium]|nr:neutral/alkaline non-lysosomal ceramidase N-terminal domain-containing protein [Planctomycetota bacterium]
MLQVIIIACSLAGPGEGWKAGIARVAITPEEPLWLAGYGGRDHPATGKIHDLWIKVLALEDARGSRAVVVTGDVLGFPRVMYEHLAGEFERRFGLDRARILLAASHTHSGPVLRESLLPYYPLDAAMLERIEAYSDALEAKILDAAGRAIANAEPARLLAGEGRAGFAVNRRENREADVPRLLAENIALAGPVDHTVPVLAVRAQDGHLIALLFGYACHCTNLDTYLWCGDYAGFAQIALEEAHAGAAALFWAGCGADQNPLPRRSLTLCRMYGTMLAAAVEEVLRAPMRPLEPRLRAAFAPATLAYEKNPTREDLEAAARSSNPVRARWARRMRAILDAGGTFAKDYPYPVTAWRLGDQLWIHLGGEAVVDYAIRCRREFGSATWVAAFANDCMGYIPSRRVWEEGGYEGGALAEYDLPAERWTGDVEDRVFAAIERAVREANAIARIEKSLYLRHPRPGAAALVSMAYAGPALERMEVRGVEARDDPPSEIGIRFSEDDGRTWTARRRSCAPDHSHGLKDAHPRSSSLGSAPHASNGSAGGAPSAKM